MQQMQIVVIFVIILLYALYEDGYSGNLAERTS